MNPSMGYTHTVFVGIGTAQNCQPCDGWSQEIYDLYNSGNYDFHYVEMIAYDEYGWLLNEKASQWMENYSATAFPTTVFDNDYERIQGGAHPELIPIALNNCGNRAVAGISANMMVSWLGDATIQVDIIIRNNEQTQYNGFIRAYITEIISRYITYYHNYYHFGFLDYAFNEDITIGAGGTYTDSVTWNGNEHEDNHGDNFGDIELDNIQLVLEIFNTNNDGYVDETVMARIGANYPPYPPSDPSPHNGAINVDVNAILSWTGIDPNGDSLTYDVYFESYDPTPDVLVSNNQSENYYDPPGQMQENYHYYWQIVAWDPWGEYNTSPVWDFETGETINNPPEPPYNPSPEDGETGVDIDANLSWTCIDPDGDDLVYKVIFEADDPTPNDVVSDGQIETTYDPGLLDYKTNYYWKIIATDEHGASTVSPIWNFTTQKNKAPIVKISKPLKALYIFNNYIMQRLFRLPKIIGGITIKANATDEDSDIERVEFFINGKLKQTDTTEPYTYFWRWDRLRIFHIFIIEIKAYDTGGLTSTDSILVKKLI